MTHQLHCGHNAEVLKQYPDSHFDVIITDPPYGIEFLGKDWDSHTGTVETWQQCLRVLKPGGHLLAFSAARTYHHLATNIESVGFEIRDQLMWIYSSGFPKAQDIGKSIERRQGKRENANTGDKWENASGKNSTGVNTTTCRTCKRNNVTIGSQFHCKNSLCDMRERLKPAQNQWAGWKTALKPGHEPIVMARRPFKGSTIDNVLQHGVGALNIDVSRIPYEDQADMKSAHVFTGTRTTGMDGYCEPTGTLDKTKETIVQGNLNGRYPSNVLGEIADYQKYFYCAKVSRKERHTGFEDLPKRLCGPGGDDFVQAQDHQRSNTNVGNNHPTVKPVALMRYLIQLVTPANSRVLDPFMGSGSTGMAALELGHQFVGIDLDANYVSIADRRILGWCAKNPIETKIKTESPMVAVTKPHSAFDRLFE